MRDLTNIVGLLNRASARQDAGPTYRFHGHRSPANRKRTPVLATVPSSNTADGVAKLRLYEPIDSWGGPWGVSAVEFLEVLDQLDPSVNEIRLHINSPGGEVWEALAILNSLRAHDAKVVAVVDGIAASCASFIAAAADETVMMPNTQLMIHDAWGVCIGPEDDMHSTGDLLGQVSDNIASIYAGKAGGNVAGWRATMKNEAWLNAQEAVDAGLADRVEGSEAGDGEDPANGFDLKGIGMKYAGRAEAPPPVVPAAPVEQHDAPVPTAQSRRHRANAKAVEHGLPLPTRARQDA